ncbi:MAG: hypothetical protein OXI49_11055 [Acidobacteriota bacterium]|nr:hypothetical protein [Acidobacteriota bacterium]
MPSRKPRESTRHHSDVGRHRGEAFRNPVRDRQRRAWRSIFPILSLFALAGLTGPAKAAAPALETTDGTEALRLYLDCDWGCDFTFLRTQITYVNWVRDRQDAEVHVLVTIQGGGNSREYTFNFIGLERFEGTDQRLIHASSYTDTDDERRRGIQRLLELGLVRYVLETPQAAGLVVEFQNGEAEDEPHTLVVDDPWNHWVYRLRLNTDFRSEDRRDSQSYQTSASAGRTTDLWRMGMGVFYSYRESNFEFEDGSTFKNVSRSTSYFGQVIRTLAPHWGVGVGASSRRSTFLNLDNSYRAAAAIEYNYFPYSESSEREFTFAYFIGGTRLDYEEVTVYDKLEETYTDQGAYIAFGMERPWGEAHLDLQYSHFIDDFDRSRIELSTDIEYHIVRGLSFDVYAGVSRIRDQIYLPKGGATDAEVLVARRQLETDLSFRGGIQLRYTFGSIYNNVVNSRLSSESGGFSRIF